MTAFAHALQNPRQLIAWAWLGWALSWWLAAFWSRRAVVRAGVAEAPSWLVTALGLILTFIPFKYGTTPHWQVAPELLWAMLVFAVAGFALAWWARLHLGALWSGSVTRKEGHVIVQTGPYALARHPIYTGLILAVFATAVTEGRLLALLGAALVLVGFWLKARLEERLLSEELGADYAAYRQRVRMLVPFVF